MEVEKIACGKPKMDKRLFQALTFLKNFRKGTRPIFFENEKSAGLSLNPTVTPPSQKYLPRRTFDVIADHPAVT
jgi:hypothetical protein